jgi:uncharacterized membrane protein (UPF0127 family)
MRALNLTRDTEIAGNLAAATGIFSRMKGLLGRKSLPAGEGLWIKPCKSIHTIGMKFPIDVIFLDAGNMVVAALPAIQPGRLSPFYASAASVIELPVGTIEQTATQPGDSIALS